MKKFTLKSQEAAASQLNRAERRAAQLIHTQEHIPLNRAQRRAIRFNRVLELVPLCESHIYGLQARGLFPKGFSLVPGGRSVAYWEDEIITWLEQRAAEGGAK